MACIEKIKHDVPHCTAELGLQTFYDDAKGKYTGFCFSCASRGLEAYVSTPYKEGEEREPPPKKTAEEIAEEIEEIKKCPYPNFKHRGIEIEYFKRARIKMAFSEYDGVTPNSFNFPFTEKGNHVGYKTIVLGKKIMWSVGNIKNADLFNWEVAKKKGVKRLYVTEGEWDCLALEEMLETSSGGKYKYAVTSVPHGASSAAGVLGRMRKEIESLFDEVVLVFDNDEAGYNAVREVQKVMPKVLEAPNVSGVKDANDALNSASQKAFVDYAMWKARKPAIEGVVTVSQATERGMKSPEMGLSYPWESVTKVLYGQKFGEATCIAGAVGSGKTLMAHEIIAHNIITHDLPCFAALLEEPNLKTLWNVAGKVDSLTYNRPEIYEANKERYFETIKRLENKLFLWNSQGSGDYRFNLPEILNAIRFNNMEYGCRSFFIDNMTRLTDQMPSTETNEFINKYSSEIANLAEELNINIFLYSHLNPPKGRDAISHEEGGEIFPNQLTGSRGIMRSFPTIMGFERNQYAEGDFSPDNSFISILKNRDYGEKMKIKTKYNPRTGRLLEHRWVGDSLF